MTIKTVAQGRGLVLEESDGFYSVRRANDRPGDSGNTLSFCLDHGTVYSVTQGDVELTGEQHDLVSEWMDKYEG